MSGAPNTFCVIN